jgi:uncharacterized protein YegL
MTNKDYTHLALIVDRSGSMSNIAQDMNGGIMQLLADQAKEPGYCVVDITTFDTVIEYPFQEVRPDDVKGEIIVPRGATALNDAIGMTIVRLGERFAKMPEEERPGLVICVVVTDGMENASKEYTVEQAKALVERQQKEWGWQFIFLAANVDAFSTGQGYGFAKGSTMNFAPSAAGVTNSYGSASRKMSETRVATASGLDNTVEFDATDREEAMEK